MMVGLTKYQLNVLKAIIMFKLNNDGCSPTHTELIDLVPELNSKTGVNYHLNILEKKGYIKRVGSRSKIKIVGGYMNEARRYGLL